MPSQFDQMFADATPVMFEAAGETEEVTYMPPAGKPFRVAVIKGEHSVVLMPDPRGGELTQRETTVIHVEAAKMVANGVDGPQYSARVKLAGDDIEWSVNPNETRWQSGAAMATVGLIRRPQIRKQEARRASA